MVLVGSIASIDAHLYWPGHPERPERLSAIEQALGSTRLDEVLIPLVAPPASPEDLLRVHTEAYLDALAQLSGTGGGELGPHTSVAPGSWRTAPAAAGLGPAAVDAIETGAAEAAFLALRPPGHHATRGRGMGFCLINNVTVTAAYLTARGQKVLILDWDVHHGNGTQDIFWDDPMVLYASTHQWPAYPGTGRASEVGGPAALGLTVNVPLPPGATGEVARLAVERIVAPAAEAFAPDWLLISAGYDAHRADPLGDFSWSAGDFADLTADARALVPDKRKIVAFLEGGYNLEALGSSVAATIAALEGLIRHIEPPTAGGPGTESVLATAQARLTAGVGT